MAMAQSCYNPSMEEIISFCSVEYYMLNVLSFIEEEIVWTIP